MCGKYVNIFFHICVGSQIAPTLSSSLSDWRRDWLNSETPNLCSVLTLIVFTACFSSCCCFCFSWILCWNLLWISFSWFYEQIHFVMFMSFCELRPKNMFLFCTVCSLSCDHCKTGRRVLAGHMITDWSDLFTENYLTHSFFENSQLEFKNWKISLNCLPD